MPKSKVRKKTSYTPPRTTGGGSAVAPAKVAGPTHPVYVAVMLGLMLLGLLWLRGTPRGRVDRHRCACVERTRRVKINHPGHFMARDQRFTDGEDARSAVSVVMQVRPADPDVAHPQPHLPGIWLGAGNLLGPHVLLAMDPHGAHASSSHSTRPSSQLDRAVPCDRDPLLTAQLAGVAVDRPLELLR